MLRINVIQEPAAAGYDAQYNRTLGRRINERMKGGLRESGGDANSAPGWRGDRKDRQRRIEARKRGRSIDGQTSRRKDRRSWRKDVNLKRLEKELGGRSGWLAFQMEPWATSAVDRARRGRG